jgi:hypothetical protein
MTRTFLLLGFLTFWLLACGKYGPPVRSQAPPPAASSSGSTPIADEEEQKNAL